MTTISSGVQFGGGVILSPTARLQVIQNGLVMNLQTAPTSGGTWLSTTGSNNAIIVNQTAANVGYVSTYGGGVRILTKLGAYFNTGMTGAQLGNTFTVSLTVAFDQTTSYWATWFATETYNSSTGYYVYQPNSTTLTTTPGPGLTFSTAGANIANVNVWDFTYDGTKANIYLNGNVKATGTITIPTAGTANLLIASRHQNAGGDGNDTAPGTYYSMRVYNRALSNVEVATNYTTLKQIHGLP